MATIVDTLFGISPERLERQRAEEADARALQFAKLNPFEQANFAIGRGAYGLAGALGGALGGQDPELQRVTMRQQLLGTIDPSRPETFDLAAQAAEQAGDTQLAFGLRLEAPKYREQARIAQDQEQERKDKLLARQQKARVEEIARLAFKPGEPTLYGKPTPFPTVDEEGNLMPGAGMSQPSFDIQRVMPELLTTAAGQAKLKELIAAQELTMPKTVSVKEGEIIYSVPTTPGGDYKPVMTGGAKPTPFTGDMANAALSLYRTADPEKIFAQYGQKGIDAVNAKALETTKEKRPVTYITNPVTISTQKGFGEAFQDTVAGNQKAGRSAVSTLGTIQNMQALLDEGVRTGFGQESILALNKAGQLFDPEFKIKGVAGQEAFQSFATGIILPQVKQLGVNPTDADLKFISTGSPGLSKTVEGNKLLLSALDLKLKREVDLAKFTNQFLRQNKDIVLKDPLEADILYSEAFNAYTQTSPLYGPAADNLRQRFNAIGTARSTNPAARTTLERGGLVNPQ
jgi:hypothetical protein